MLSPGPSKHSSASPPSKSPQGYDFEPPNLFEEDIEEGEGCKGRSCRGNFTFYTLRHRLYDMLSTMSSLIIAVHTNLCLTAPESPQPKPAPSGTKWQAKSRKTFPLHTQIPVLCMRIGLIPKMYSFHQNSLLSYSL